MAEQEVFSRSVRQFLPNAIPSQLDSIDEFSIGKVLVYKKKPKKSAPWIKSDMEFTGYSISSLMDKGNDKLEGITSSSDFLFESGDNSSEIQFDLDEKMKKALVEMGLQDLKSKKQKYYVVSNLGKVAEVSTNIFDIFTKRDLKVNKKHEVIKKAGSSLFVISTLFNADQVDITIQTKQSEESAPTTVKKVCNIKKHVPVGFLAMQLSIDSNGVLKPKLKARRNSKPVEYVVPETVKQSEKPASPNIEVPHVNPTESFNFAGWVVVDLLDIPEEVEEEEEEDEEAAKNEATPTTAPPPPAANNMYTAEQKLVKGTSAVPPRPNDTPFQLESTMSITEPKPGQFYECGVETFAGFTSSTYDGVMLEAKNWIQPLLDNQALQKSFLTYSKSPRLKQKLEKLLNYLQDLRDALCKQENPPKNTNSALNPVISKLTDFWSTQLDEVSALLIATQGFLEFSPSLLKRLNKLSLVKRNVMFELIRNTPYGSTAHVYLDKGPYTDEDLYPILIQLGFSVQGQRLAYNAITPNEDILEAVIVVLQSSARPLSAMDSIASN